MQKERFDERRSLRRSSLTRFGRTRKQDGGPRAPDVLILPGERLRRWNWNLLSRDRDHVPALHEGGFDQIEQGKDFGVAAQVEPGSERTRERTVGVRSK